MRSLGAGLTANAAALLGILTCLFAVSLFSSPARAASFTRGFTDDAFSNPQWVARAVPTGAKLVLLDVTWAGVEPMAPAPGSNPTDPSGPEYFWPVLDTVLRSFSGTGISVGLLISQAPPWAEAPGGPAPLEADGAWQPSATAFGQFATALAKRYSGSYADPLKPGQSLPRVRIFQAWAEANFIGHLAPQWVKHGGTWVPAAPAIYRGLLNAFYAGVKSVHSNNQVITTGPGPYGDAPGACAGSVQVGSGCRMSPGLFVREMLCLHGQALSKESCPNPAHFDVLAMDPYETFGPTSHALTIDDVSAPDLSKLRRILTKAGRTGRALPGGHKPLWVTEFGYESKPPNPGGVSTATQAHWLEEAFYVFWKQGVSAAVWYLIRDVSATYSSGALGYTGVFFYNGQPKPSYEAFRFPFVVMPNGSAAQAWGISPRSGSLVVELHHGRSWKTLFHVRVSAGGVFSHKLSAGLSGNFRAVVGGESSLVWRR